MEVSGIVFRSIPSVYQNAISKSCFPGGGKEAGGVFSGEIKKMSHQDLRVCVKPRKLNGFCDDGHIEYYRSSKITRCGGVKEKEKELESKEKKMKKKLKLLKGLSKNISMFSGIDFGLDPDHGLATEVKGQMISEAADMLLTQLQQLKAEKKEFKRQRKEEKSKLKALRMQNKMECKGDSSSSESSDGECGEVIDMNHLKTESLALKDQQLGSEASTLTIPSPPNMVVKESSTSLCNSQIFSSENCTSANKQHSYQENSISTESSSCRKIEVCMGGKCKKLGAATLLDEFQKAVGLEGSVVGCKCMGKCRSAPNVKVLNSIDGLPSEVEDDSVRTPANPLCIGVGLEDVGTIVTNFFGSNQKDLGLATAL